jgi:lipoyl(octanoyl) transferase
MPPSASEIESFGPALEAFLLGRIDFDVALTLQQRLVEQARDRDDGQISLFLCEHPPLITVGRGGKPENVAMQSGLVRNRQIEVRWVNRGGGCLVHCPGQLAIYPIVPLQWHGLSVDEFLHRLQAGIIESLDDLNVPTRPQYDEHSQPAHEGVWGRTGQLAVLGVAVRHWITYYGAYLNVCPPMGLFRLVETDPQRHATMSSLVAERCGPVRMTGVRASLVRRLAERFGCDRYHLHTGHPMLRRASVPQAKMDD